MRNVLPILLSLAILASVANAAENGTGCSAPGKNFTCTDAPNFCLNLSYYDENANVVNQTVCNCLNTTVNGQPSRCTTSLDCCPGPEPLYCSPEGYCINGSEYYARYKDKCNAFEPLGWWPTKFGKNNCFGRSTSFCQPDSETSMSGACIYVRTENQTCNHNYECGYSKNFREMYCGLNATGDHVCMEKDWAKMPVEFEACRIDLQNRNEQTCNRDFYCEFDSKRNSQDGTCRPQVAIGGAWCKDDYQCQSNGKCLTFAGVLRQCVNPSFPEFEAKYCRDDSECLSANCTGYGWCEPYRPKKLGEKCTEHVQCLSEKCDMAANKCIPRGDGEFCVRNDQCDISIGLDCNKTSARQHGFGVCAYPDAGSNPVITFVETKNTTNGNNVKVVIRNMGRHETKDSFSTHYLFTKPDGTVAYNSDSSYLVPARLQPGTEGTYTQTVAGIACDPATPGLYRLRINLTAGSSIVPSKYYANIPVTKYIGCGDLCRISNDWQKPVLVSITTVVGLIALAYALGFALSNQTLKGKAAEELGAVAVSLFIIVAILFSKSQIEGTLFDLSCKYYEGENCTSGGDLISLATNALDFSESRLTTSMGEIMRINDELSKQSTKSSYCNIYGVSITTSGCSSYNVGRGLTSQLITATAFGQMDNVAKKTLLQVACAAALSLALPLGIILRSFRFSRMAGTYLVALAIGFYFVFPFAIVFSDGLVSRYLASGEAQNDAAIGNALNLTTANPMPAQDVALKQAMKWPDMTRASWTRNSELVCEADNMERTQFNNMIDNVSKSEIADVVVLNIALRGLFVTGLSLSITLGFVRAFASALGAEIEVSQLARLT